MLAWDFRFRLFDMLRVSALRWSAKHGIEVALFIKSCEQNAHEPIFYGIKNKLKNFLKNVVILVFIWYYITWTFLWKEKILWKLDHQLNQFAKNAKSLKEKGLSELSVKIQSTNSVRDNDWIESEWLDIVHLFVRL